VKLYERLAEELEIDGGQVRAALRLLDEGNTIPFIARYRKEQTGELDEDALRKLEERAAYLRALEERKREVLRLIAEQGKLTPELEQRIRRAEVLQEVEDLYLPYRPKRRTRATLAREKGLEPLAELIAGGRVREGDPLEMAAAYVDTERGVETPEEALRGALDIIAEEISEDAEVRRIVRELTWREGFLTARANDPTARSVYETYYNYCEPLAQVAPHRVLAVNRGEREEYLKVGVEVDEEEALRRMQAVRPVGDHLFSPHLHTALRDAYRRLIAPSIEREVRKELTERAQERAIAVFQGNLRSLLMQRPLLGSVVLGIDPAYRTGCKYAVVDPTGKVLETGVIYPTKPRVDLEGSARTLRAAIRAHSVRVIAIGNGTGSRETELFVADLLRDYAGEVAYLVVDEAGASVYSASPLAAEELPDLDVSLRGAVSIARRVIDPLAELVKIDPRSVGVGQYQHDVDQRKLSRALAAVVESCVNYVGVDVNTASVALLSYVAGINAAVARNIVERREKVGPFRSRRELLEVPRLGQATFTQCSGFLRVRGGDEPLDDTPIHPESYAVAYSLLERVGLSAREVARGDVRRLRSSLLPLLGRDRSSEFEALARELGVGQPTLRDIVEALLRPGRDPREDLPAPLFRTDVLEMEDLRPGMVLTGTVRNVTDFGAFVDIGVKRDGLVHRSEMGEGRIGHPWNVVSVGDVVSVRVLAVDPERGRISLSMRELS